MTDERAFLTAILEQPDDDLRKLAYADWLEEQGDPRAEYLRLMLKVRLERVVTPEQRQRHQELTAELAQLRTQEQARRMERRRPPRRTPERRRRMQQLESELADLSQQLRPQIPRRLQELSAKLDPNWLGVVSDPAIEGCAKNAAEGSFRFDFVCDKTWADLTPACDGQKVRHCETCRKNVHFCDTITDARDHARQGRCIAVDLGIIRREGDLEPERFFMGRVSADFLRRRHEDDINPVSQARLDARK